MASHFPFSGKADRVSVFAFYERHGLPISLQEKYYRWWYEWAKRIVQNDPELAAVKGVEFERFPYGQHAAHDFHLHKYPWCTTLIDLGGFIEAVLLPRLSPEELHRLEQEHDRFLKQLKEEAAKTPREATPEVGRYRHV